MIIYNECSCTQPRKRLAKLKINKLQYDTIVKKEILFEGSHIYVWSILS